MPLLQDLLFGSYLARKQRENEVARAEAMRPDEEFKAGVTRATDAARVKVAAEQADWLEEMRRRRERKKPKEDTEDELNVETQYGQNPLYPRTSRGATAARNEELATGSKARSEFNLGYIPFARGIGDMEGSRKNLETVNDRNRLAGQYGVSYRLGETAADSELARHVAAANVARATSALTPGRTALEQAQNAEATASAAGKGKLERAKIAADLDAESLRGMVNYDRAERGQDAVDTDRSLTELNKVLAQSDLSTARRLFDPNTGSPIDAAIHLGGGRIQQGTAIPGVNYPSPSEDIKMVKDPLTGIEKPMAVREAGKPVPTLGRRLLAPGASSKSNLPPVGIGKLPDDGNQPPPPAVQPIAAPKSEADQKASKLIEAEKLRLSDTSNWTKADWYNLAHKSYGLGNIIEPHKSDVIRKLQSAMTKEIETGRDFRTGAQLSPEVIAQVKQQLDALMRFNLN
jgi:hypothetical protein